MKAHIRLASEGELERVRSQNAAKAAEILHGQAKRRFKLLARRQARQERRQEARTVYRPLRLSDVPPGSIMAPATLEAIAKGDYVMAQEFAPGYKPPFVGAGSLPKRNRPAGVHNDG